MIKKKKNRNKIVWRSLICSALMVGALVFQQAYGQAGEQSLLWKIKGNGIQPSYLFGTIHILPEAAFELKPKVEEAFQNTDQLVLELDMDDPNLQAEMMTHMKMKGGKTLKQLFSKADYDAVDKELKKASGVGLKKFNAFKPFFLTSILVSKLMGEQVASFEFRFVQMAKAQEKEVLGLETIAFQAGVFDKIPYEEQASDVLDLVYNSEKHTDLFQKLIGFYQEEKIDSLYQIMKDDRTGENELEVLLYERNRNWVSSIKGLAENQSSFFAVGAGHLGGESGMIALLKKAGYTVSPVK